MESISEVACVNCEAVCSTSFCGNCGQQSAVKQLKWSTLFYELNQRWIGLDNKFAKTIRDLTIRPEQVMKAFIQGNRVKYVGPMGYFFVLISIFVVLISFLNVDIIEFSKGLNILALNEAEAAETADFQRNLMGDMRLMSLFVTPFYVFATYLLFFRKGYNLIETAVPVLYSVGHTSFLTILSLLLFKFFEISTITYAMVLSMIYFGYVFARFYSGNKIWSFIKGFFSYFLAIIMVMILGSIVIGMLFLIDPEMAKEFLKIKN